MRWQPFLAPAVIAAGFAVGWFAAPPVPAPPEAPGALAPIPVHGGEELGAAVRRLAALDDFDGARFADMQPVAIEPAPPEIDIGVHFRREVTAIVDGRALWVVDEAAALRRRELKVGDRYRDEWRVAAIDEQTVTLMRRGETRALSVVDIVPEEMIAAPYEPPPPRIPPTALLGGVNQRAAVDDQGIDRRRSSDDPPLR